MTTTVSGSRTEAIIMLGHAFKRTNSAVRRLRGRETQRPGTPSYSHQPLLFALDERGALSSGELATATDLSPATVTQMIDSLVGLGLVTRTRSETDRRVVSCTLTDAGRAYIADRRVKFEGLWNAALSDFTVGELAVAAAVLEQIATMFESLDGDV